MNQFIKSNKLWLSLLGLAIIIVFLAFLFRPKSPEYQTGTEQAVKMMIDPQNQVVISDLAGKQLIDIRSVDLYEQGHPENAINIPVRNLLDKESLELFDRLLKSGQVAALYGSDELQAVAPCLLLQQMGYTNLKTLKGGLVATNEFKESALVSTETSVLDISAIRVNPELVKTTEKKPEKKNPETVVPVRKQATSGGGC